MNNRVEIAKEFANKINSDKIVKIILFGSVARGDDGDESDIDILIVSPFVREIRDEINDIVVDIIINDEELISAHLMTEDHFNETKNFPFLTNVLEEGIVLG
jgi:predicted nucleotidyltransferase